MSRCAKRVCIGGPVSTIITSRWLRRALTSTAYPLAVALLYVLVGVPPATAERPLPIKDFPRWHKEWVGQVSGDYAATHCSVWKRGGEPPVIMHARHWRIPGHQLVWVDNSRIDHEFLLVANPRYAAQLTRKSGVPDRPWRLRELARHGRPGHAALVGEFGISVGLVYRCEEEFRRPYRMTAAVAPVGAEAVRFEFTDENATVRPRAPTSITIVCSNSHQQPIEVRIEEKNGGRSLKVIEGWGDDGDGWRPSETQIFYQEPGAEQMVLHSIKEWDFKTKQSVEREEMYLSHYGIPEIADTPR